MLRWIVLKTIHISNNTESSYLKLSLYTYLGSLAATTTFLTSPIIIVECSI